MKKKRLLKLLFAVTIVVVMVMSEAMSAFAAVSDEFGVFPASAAPKNTEADWYGITGYNGFVKGDKYFEIKTVIKNQDVSLYISFPELGGFRMENEKPAENPESVEKTGIFEPESNDTIKYSVDAKNNIVMTSDDGTMVKFVESGKLWYIEVTDQDNVKLFKVKAEQIAFGFNNGKIVRTRLEMPLSTEEVIYGTGERFNGVNQNGRRTMMWNSDAAYHADGYSELWRSYKNVPILHSSRGYSLFYNSFCSATVDIGYTNENKYTLDFEDSRLDFYLWTGSMKENIVKYTDLTGKPFTSDSDWAYSYMTGGSNGYWKNGGESTPIALSQLSALFDSYEEMGTPVKTVYAEHATASASSVANNMAKNKGAVMLRWNNADFISPTEAQSYLSELDYSDLPFARLPKNPTKYVGSWVDYTDDNGIELLTRWLKQHTDLGIKGGMCDFAELIQVNTLFSNGLTGEKMHNFYTYFYGKAYNTAYSKLTNNDWLCYIRGASAGTQKWIPVWLGDQYASVDGMKMQLSGLLSLGASGFSLIGADIGGLDGKPSDTLYQRSLQMANFMPIMRSGGNVSKNPTDYNEQTQAAYKKAYWLRENLANKIKSSSIKSNITGLPMAQAMGIAFDGQLDLYSIENEYLFCDDFLFTAVFDNSLAVETTLPNGNWYDLVTGKKYEGGQKVMAESPYDTSPVYVRAGAAVPITVGYDLKLGTSMLDIDTTEALLVTPADVKRTSVYHPDKKTTVTYTNEPVNENTFRITYDEGNTAENLLVYGVSAYSVTVDGKKLPQIDKLPTDSSTIGYYVDSNNVTKIYLGTEKWENVDICLGKYNDSNIVKSFNDEEANILVNGDYNTLYNTSKDSDYELVATLTEKTKINSLVLKWTNTYANGYKISVSEDGSNWTEVKTLENSTGGIEKTEFEPVTAKYLKITDITSSTGALPSLYKFEVHKVLGKADETENIYSDKYTDVDYDDDDYYDDDVYDEESEEVDEDDEIVVLKKRRKKKSAASSDSILGLEPWLFYTIVGIVSALVIGAVVTIVLIILKKRKMNS